MPPPLIPFDSGRRCRGTLIADSPFNDCNDCTENDLRVFVGPEMDVSGRGLLLSARHAMTRMITQRMMFVFSSTIEMEIFLVLCWKLLRGGFMQRL